MIINILQQHGYEFRKHPRYPYGVLSAGGMSWPVRVDGDRISSDVPWLRDWIDSLTTTANGGSND